MILTASYVFYGYWDWRFLTLLAAMTFGNEVAAVTIHRTQHDPARRLLVGLAVGLDLIVLAFFKYYGFFTGSLADTFGLSSPVLNVILPIGSRSTRFRQSAMWSMSTAVIPHRPDFSTSRSTFRSSLSSLPARSFAPASFFRT